MKIYTRTGDGGSTALGDGVRVSKSSSRVAAYGEVDELNSVVGVLLADDLPGEAREQLRTVQEALFEVGAFLASPARHDLPDTVRDPAWVERWIDAMEVEVPPLRTFILPGGARSAALAHQARAVCRRAERRIVRLADDGAGDSQVLPFLNRLSDALFVLARWLNQRAGFADVPWRGRRTS